MIPSSFELIPVEIQQQLLQKLDEQSLLNARVSCQTWQKLIDTILDTRFETGYQLQDYAVLPEKFSLSTRSLFNMRVDLAAKKAWKSIGTSMQYRKIAPRRAHEMGQPIHSFPVNMVATSANAAFLYSEEGSRWQQSMLLVKSAAPLVVRTAANSPMMKDLSLKDIGSIQRAKYDGDNIVCLTRENNAYFLVMQNLSFTEAPKKIPLDISDVSSHFFTQGKLFIGNTSGDLFEFSYDLSGNIALSNKSHYSAAVQWMGVLPDNTIAVFYESEVGINHADGTKKVYPLEELKGMPAISGSSVIALRNNGDLIELDPKNSPVSITRREGVESFLALDNNQYLVTTVDGQLESWIGDLRIASYELEQKMILTAASQHNGLVAIALKNDEHEEIIVFAEEMNQLTKLFEKPNMNNKGGVHTLHLTKTFELLITTNDGTILTVRPFPSDKTRQ